MEHNENNMFLCIIIFVFIFLFAVLAMYLNVIRPFLDDRTYIKLEIRRAYSEREQRYWKSELKKLYVSHIPLFGRILVRFIDR